MSNIEQNELFNFLQGSDISGESAFDIWKSLNPTGGGGRIPRVY